MEQFDDMLRNSLANDNSENRFEFKEEYWLQAAALIESDERKRKRRFAFWIFGGLMLGGLATAYFYSLGGQQAPSSVSPGAPPPTSERPMAQRSTMPASQQATTATANSLASHSNSKDHSFERNLENNPQNNLPAFVTSEGSSQKTALQVLPPAKQTLEMIPEAAVTTTATTPTNEHQLIISAAQVPGLLFGYVSSELAGRAPIVQGNYTALPAESAAITKVHHPKKWRFGIVAAAGTPSGLFDEEIIPLAGGAMAKYTINDHWSLNASINWRQWKGSATQDSNSISNNWDALKSAYFSSNTDKSYSFGYHQITTNRYVKAFHTIEMPVSVAYQIKDIAAEAGLLLTWVAFTQNREERYEERSLAPEKALADAASFLSANNEALLQKFIPGATAGIYYNPGKHWSIGLRSTFRPKEASYSPEYRSLASKEETELTLKSFTTDLQLRWFF